ncbi:hypothetical protein [Nocardiopsis valliformis]|uniref:hypothetical protein n=1 Tax=Nocardiopsis valliformis TaxID=239974 RepID=UPI00034BE016|nr:hypothetical protein [Nocardiopsis valliformis]
MYDFSDAWQSSDSDDPQSSGSSETADQDSSATDVSDLGAFASDALGNETPDPGSFIPESALAGAPAVAALQGRLPRHHDHVVRIGVEVEPHDEAGFLGTVRGQSWQLQRLGEGEYDVRVAVSGAALGAAKAALAEFHHVLTRAGVDARVVFVARLRRQEDPTRRYLVLPRGWMPAQEWIASPLRALMFWRSRGTIQATSLAGARSMLAGFAERNPEAGPPDELMVVGPPDQPGAVAPAPITPKTDPLNDWRFLLVSTLLIAAGVVFIGLYVFLWLPEQIPTLAALAFLVSIPCLFGLWQMLRRIPEGRINRWLPLGLTAVAPPLTVALSNSSHDVYLEQFGITPGEVAPTSAGRLFAVADTLPLVLFALLFSLGVFGLLRYFHVSARGREFPARMMAAGAVCVYILASVNMVLVAVIVPLERGAKVGTEHIAQYQAEGGGPVGHVGVQPTVVCVGAEEDPVSRIGAPLTTDRPVLYFEGENDIDLLWDREHGLTKLPRFSVSLTPVTDLDDTCSGPQRTG